MRFLYVIVGLLLGSIMATRQSGQFIEVMMSAQYSEVLTNKLVGFHEGYRYGYLRMQANCHYLSASCYEQLQYAQVYVQELKGKCYTIKPQ
jgi:hypothetical protein